MAQATSRRTTQVTALVTALYDVAAHARRFQSADPVDTAGVRLLYLLSRLGRSRPSDLASAALLDLSTVSRHLRTLEEQGLVARQEDPDDRRAQLVAVTSAGDAAMSDVLHNRVAALGTVLDRWPAGDRAELGRLLRRLADDLETEHCDSKDRL